MKKGALIALAAGLLFSIGLTANTSTSVQAARKTAVLRCKSYVYTIHGKRTRSSLKKNKHVRYSSSKWIKGHQYYRIGKNKYIRTENTRPPYLFRVTVTSYDDDAGLVFRSPNKPLKYYEAISGGTVYQRTIDKKGQGWYRVSKNRWILAKYTNRPYSKKVTKKSKKIAKHQVNKKVIKKVTKKVNKTNKAKNYSTKKNAAAFMSYLLENSSLSAAQRDEVTRAGELLRTGASGFETSPSWFSKYVKLGAKNDATSAENMKKALPNMERANKARKEYGLSELKVSPVMLAISMIDADYQKQGGLNHPQHYREGLENLAAGAEPISMWLSEKSNWQWDVKKDPSLAQYEFTPGWGGTYNCAAMGENGYKTAGHYLNLLNRTHTVMGMAHMTQNNYGFVDSFNADSRDSSGSFTVSQYKDLLNNWLAK